MLYDWCDYQRQTAEFFSRLGLKTTVECRLEGARATHKVDVLVEGKFHGIAFRWVIECKAWKSAIPKEKVMALSTIVQDLGADRGFLLSETGFQAGAIRAVRNTNITLSSLESLAAETEGDFVDATISALMYRMYNVRQRLRQIKRDKYDDDYYPPTMEPLMWLFALDFAFDDALRGEYPVIYQVEGDVRHKVSTLNDLLTKANILITRAELWQPPDEI